MKDFVSNHWFSVLALVAALSAFCAILGPYGLPWTGLAWVSLAACAGVFLALRSTRSIWQVIRDVETEPRLAVALAERVATPTAERGSELK